MGNLGLERRWYAIVTRRRGEPGFTLIELLIVVAILGILAAVVVPNLGRLLGGGETTAQNSEYESVKTGVVSMMVDNGLASLPNPVSGADSPCTTGTQDMADFPDDTVATLKGNDSNGNPYQFGDGAGYILFGNDITGNNSSATGLINYVETATAQYCYQVTSLGALTQFDTSGNALNPR